MFSIDAEDFAFLLRSLPLVVVLPRLVRVELGRSSASIFDGVLLRGVLREYESARVYECRFPSLSS